MKDQQLIEKSNDHLGIREHVERFMSEDEENKRFVLDKQNTSERVANHLTMYYFDVSERTIRRVRSGYHRKVLVLSDWQCDLHDQEFLAQVLELAYDLSPEVIVHVGDESDNTTIGRWVEGAPDEIEGNLQDQLDITKDLLRNFRRIPSVETMGIVSSNHGLRFERSVRSRIPAFRSLRALRYENLLELESLGIDYHRGLWEVLPGVVAAHGDQWSLTSNSQYTRLSKEVLWKGKSIVCGHTHRPMLTSVASDRRNLWAMNVGHSMDTDKADYMLVDRGGSDQWGQAVGVITWDGFRAHPELVQRVDGRLHYNGQSY